VKRLHAAVALLAAFPACAAPFAAQVGDVRLGLDAPPGFADTLSTGSPRLQELAESLTSASNRILLFAISDADLRRFSTGDPLELRRYMIVVTPRGSERERMSESAFKVFTGESLRALGPPPADANYQKHLDAQPVGAASFLAELRRDPDVVSVLQGTRTKAGGLFQRSSYLVSTTTLLLLRGKALHLAVFGPYDDPADVEWIRVTTARWIDELKRLNPR